MESNNSVSTQSSGRSRADLNQIASTCTAAEVRYVIHMYHTGFKKWAVGAVPSSIDIHKLNVLRTLNSSDIFYVLKISADAKVITVISPFNISTQLKEAGYDCEHVAKIDEKTDLGDTSLKTLGGDVFDRNELGGYFKFTGPISFFYCPIQKSFINASFTKISGFRKLNFNLQIAEVCGMLATFFQMKNGEVTGILASEAGNKLLNFERILASEAANATGYICIELTKLFNTLPCPEVRGWKHANLQGMSFAHHLYHAIISKLSALGPKAGDFISELIEICDSIIRKEGEKGFFYFESGKLCVKKPNVTFPRIIKNLMVDLPKKKATLEQAYEALKYSRGFRGVNKGLKGDLSRTANTGLTMDPGMAEEIYMLTNMKRIIPQFKDLIVLTGQEKSIGTLTTLLNVLVMLEFNGSIFLQDSTSIQALLRVKDAKIKSYSYGRSLFTVFMSTAVTDYVNRKSWIYKYAMVNGKETMVSESVPSIDSLVIDWRGNKSFTAEANILAHETAVKQHFLSYYVQWDSWSYPVLSQTSLFTDLVITHYDDLSIVSCVEMHNLVMYTCYRFKCMLEREWWYELNSTEVLSEVCAASIICNILRCMRYVYGVTPASALQSLGFKRYAMSMSALGKRNASVMIWQETNLVEAISAGTEYVKDLFNRSTTAEQTQMLLNDTVREIVMTGKEKEEDVGSSQGSQVISFDFTSQNDGFD